VKERRRSVLHVDLDPFFVSVERSLDPSLRGQPVVIGGDGQGLGFVAAVSEEAGRAGVRVGMPLQQARVVCPAAAFRRGDLDTYGRCSEEVTAVLLAASRRVERPSADEAFVDLTAESPADRAPVGAAETIRDELQRRLGLDASLGLASSRLAARIASGWAKPRGLLVVLPGYEGSFLEGKPLAALGLPPHLESALRRAGLATLGDVAGCDEAALAAAVGAASARVRAAARGEEEPPIAVAAPPSVIQEEAPLRDRRGDRQALDEMLATLARRAARRLKPFRLSARALTVEVRRGPDTLRRSESVSPGLADEEAIARRALALAGPILDPVEGVRGLLVRLSRLGLPTSQASLFPAPEARARPAERARVLIRLAGPR
jgi:DNA polymerase IV